MTRSSSSHCSLPCLWAACRAVSVQRDAARLELLGAFPGSPRDTYDPTSAPGCRPEARVVHGHVPIKGAAVHQGSRDSSCTPAYFPEESMIPLPSSFHPASTQMTGGGAHIGFQILQKLRAGAPIVWQDCGPQTRRNHSNACEMGSEWSTGYGCVDYCTADPLCSVMASNVDLHGRRWLH